MTHSNEANLAVRSRITIGSIEVDGFMLPDGSYRMSQASAAAAIDESPVYALRFLQSKNSQALLGEGYTDYTPESVEVEPEPGRRGQTRINALPLQVVAAYWYFRGSQGNRKAFALGWALLTESLERRFDNAFGINRTEQEWNQRLAEATQQLERDLTKLGEAYAIEDEVRLRLDYLEQWLEQRGLNPWEPNQSDDRT